MSLRGLPDFGAGASADGGFRGWACFESPGDYLLLADGLEVAPRPDGKPDFLLELVRGANPMLPPDPFGELDLRVRPRFHLDDALAQLRTIDPQGTLSPIMFSSGWLALVPASDQLGLAPAVLAPAPVNWNGADSGRWVLRFSPDTVTLIQKALQSQTLLLSAHAECEVLGVSPRLPFTAHFDGNALVRALLSAHSGNAIPRDALESYFLQPLSSIGITLDGGDLPADQAPLFAQAMADRVRVRFGSAVPLSSAGSATNGVGAIALTAPDPGASSFAWDLSQPLAAPRSFAFDLDPLEAARALVAQLGINAVYQEVVAPALDFGFVAISVHANLPASRIGLAALGVTVTAPPHPPARRETLTAGVEFDPPGDSGTITFHLSPSEPLNYQYAPYAVVRVGPSTQRIDAAAVAHSGPLLDLGPDDFPVQFITLSADASLLAAASLAGTVSYPAQSGASIDVPFALNNAQSEVAIATPRDAPGTLTIVATPTGAGSPITLGPAPAASRRLGLSSFSGYGPQSVAINCSFTGASPLIAIDLLPDGQPESAAATIALTPAQPNKRWTYLAASPFQSGYRYRLHADASAPPAAWSPSQSPAQPLSLSDAPSNIDNPPPPAPLSIAGVKLLPDPSNPTRYSYLPGDPAPDRGPDGKPSVSLIALGSSGALLTLSVHWGLDAALESTVRAQLANRGNVAPQAFQLSPANATIDKATLSIGDGAGKLTAIATSATSGQPPFTAAFNVSLNNDQRNAVTAALGGRAGFLIITYSVSLPASTAQSFGESQSIVRTSDAGAWFSSGGLGSVQVSAG